MLCLGSINRGEKKTKNKNQSWLLVFPGTLENWPGTRKPGGGYVCKVGLRAYVDLELCPCPSMQMPRARWLRPPCCAAFRPQLWARAQAHAQTLTRAHGDKLPFLQGTEAAPVLKATANSESGPLMTAKAGVGGGGTGSISFA